METYGVVEEQIHKKGRHRKKLLFNSIMQQMEFYFSDSNLSKDKFLLPIIEKDTYVDISIFLKFNQIRKLTTNLDDIVKAISNSQLLELSDDKTKVKRKTPLNFRKDVDNSTIYVERIKIDVTHKWLSFIFSEFGNVTYVSIPKYKHNKMNKGFAFIEYEKESEALEALNYFESIGCRMSSLMPPENLCSIITYDGNNADTVCTENNSCPSENDNIKNKRKHSIEDSEIATKRLKVENICVNNDNSDDVQNGDFEDKKIKKQKKMKRKLFKELGLQVLSKSEWKKIRNRYLDNQKVKMKQLKQFLNKKKYSSHVEMNKQKMQQDESNSKKKNNAKQEEHSCTIPYVPGVILKLRLTEPVGEPKKVKEEHSCTIPYVPGVILKLRLTEPVGEPKTVKEELKQYSTELLYVDVPQIGGNEAYLRFSDAESAKHFAASVYKGGQCSVLEGDEETQYWQKINRDHSSKVRKNQKRVRGREKLLKKAEKELGKHIKFDDTD